MKFEKLNKDKIKVTLNIDDLNRNNLDLNAFMSNSEETNSLFLDVLEKAEKDYDFSTDNYNLKVEAVALADGTFALTITRILDTYIASEPAKKKVHATRKIPKFEPTSMIYKFANFEDFCGFMEALVNNPSINYKQISKNSILYNFKDSYYLVLSNINIKSKGLKTLFTLITEFATYISSSDLFAAKLHESGKIIFKTKAIQNGVKYFG